MMGGIFGVVSHDDCVEDLFYGTDYHSHLGTHRGGLAVFDGDDFIHFIHNIQNTPFRTKFEDDVSKLTGTSGIGCISDTDDQPLVINSHHGHYAIVTVGRINNIDELVEDSFKRRSAHFTQVSGGEINQTELVATLIDDEETFEAGIRRVHKVIDGSCSLLLLTEQGIYAARDRFGRTPLIIGQRDGSYCVSSESCALPNLGYMVDYEVGPGEVVLLNHDGMDQVTSPSDSLRICSFLWIYYGYPASSYEGINVESVRNTCGAALARNDDVEVDLVAGIPDSGTGHAIGYAHEANICYGRPFVKYTPTWPRSFMPQNQTRRDLVARMKLIPVKELIEGKRIMFCEDSIVRGTQLRETIIRLFEYGAKEVHMRPACPPLVYSCKFLNFSRSKSEFDLAARGAIRELEGDSEPVLSDYADHTSEKYHAMVEKIGERLNLSSLKYQNLPDMIDAIGLTKDKVCTYCWDGKG